MIPLLGSEMKTLRDCDAYFVFCFGFIALYAFEHSLYSPYTYEKRIFLHYLVWYSCS